MAAECAVHSPCGRYHVRFTMQPDHFTIAATEKAAMLPQQRSHHHPQQHISVVAGAAPVCFRACVTPKLAVDISARAGVVKEFDTFGRMVYNALIGNTPCVKFYVETCDEMKRRIAAEHNRHLGAAEDGDEGDDSSDGHGGAFLEDGGSQPDEDTRMADPATSSRGRMSSSTAAALSSTQRFFTLDYDVDFTRAMFPIPLSEGPPLTSAASPGMSPKATSPPQSNSRATGDGKAAPRHSVGGGGGGGAAVSGAAASASLEAVVLENTRLKKQVDALSMLSKEKMLELQRECDGLQKRVAVEARLRQALHAAKATIRALQADNEGLTQQLAAATKKATPGRGSGGGGSGRGRSPLLTRRDGDGTTTPNRSRASSVDSRGSASSAQRRHGGSLPGGASPAPQGRTGNRPTRFDTPPKHHHQQQQQLTPRSNSSSLQQPQRSRRPFDSPPPHSRSAAYSDVSVTTAGSSSAGGAYIRHSSSGNGSPHYYGRDASPSTHDRLFSMSTAAAALRQRGEAQQFAPAHRHGTAVFR